MKRPAIFFDRDNTLIVSDGFLSDPAKVTLVERAADAVARARRLGFAVVVFSNQSGVARGMFGEDEVRAVNERIDQLLSSENSEAVIDRHEFCPYHPEGTVEAYRRESDLRKPSPGMIYAAAQSLALDLSRSWVIGDAPRDIEAGASAGLRTILFRDERLPPSPAAKEASRMPPEFTASTLPEAIEYIAKARDLPRAVPAEDDQGAGGELPDESATEAPDTSNAPGIDPVSGAPAPAVPQTENPPKSEQRLGQVAEQILVELRRQDEHSEPDFSVSKLLAGIAQVVSIAAVFLAYLYRNETSSMIGLLVFGVWLECLTIALLIMERQK